MQLPHQDDAAASSGPRRPAWSSPSFLNPRGFKVGEGLILPQRNPQGPSRPCVPSPADTDPVWRDTGATPGLGEKRGKKEAEVCGATARPQPLSLYCALNGDHCYRLTPGRKVMLTKETHENKFPSGKPLVRVFLGWRRGALQTAKAKGQPPALPTPLLRFPAELGAL